MLKFFCACHRYWYNILKSINKTVTMFCSVWWHRGCDRQMKLAFSSKKHMVKNLQRSTSRKTVVPTFPEPDFPERVMMFLSNHWKYQQSKKKKWKIAPSGSVGCHESILPSLVHQNKTWICWYQCTVGKLPVLNQWHKGTFNTRHQVSESCK